MKHVVKGLPLTFWGIYHMNLPCFCFENPHCVEHSPGPWVANLSLDSGPVASHLTLL